MNYRGYDVWEIPSNGHGIVALMTLNILKGFDFLEKDSIETYHRQLEAIKLAYADEKEKDGEQRAQCRPGSFFIHLPLFAAVFFSNAYAYAL